MIASFSICTALLVTSAVRAESKKCPSREQGSYPWLERAPQVIDGDLWAWVYLDLDNHGFVLRCYFGGSNISGPETRSDVCRSFVSGWRATPLMKDGTAVAGTTKRFFILAGKKHRKLYDEARKQWFAEHPEDSPSCYQ
jgi:hypothetical protein